MVVYLTTPLGVVWVSLSVAAYQVTVTLAVQILLERLIEVPVRALIYDVGPAFLSSATLFAVSFPLMKLLSMAGAPAVVVMFTVAAVGLSLYAVMMRTLFPAAWDDLMLVRATVVPRMPSKYRRSARPTSRPSRPPAARSVQAALPDDGRPVPVVDKGVETERS